MASAYWGFLLMAAHLGLHWGMFLKMVQRTRLSGKGRTVIPTILGAVTAVYGAAAMVKRDLSTYLFLRAEFVFLDFGESKILFYLDYLAIMGTFVFLTYFISKLLRKHKKKEHTMKKCIALLISACILLTAAGCSGPVEQSPAVNQYSAEE